MTEEMVFIHLAVWFGVFFSWLWLALHFLLFYSHQLYKILNVYEFGPHSI